MKWQRLLQLWKKLKLENWIQKLCYTAKFLLINGNEVVTHFYVKVLDGYPINNEWQEVCLL